MDARRTVGFAGVALAALGAALWLLAGDTGGEVAPRDVVPAARAPGPPTPVPPSAAEAPVAAAELGEAAGPAPRPVVGLDAASERFRALGVQLENARVAAPEDESREAVLAVIARAEAAMADLRAAVAAGSVPESELGGRVGQIRLDAATAFDGATGPDEARALKEALGFDMRGGDELGWGVPLTEENFGQLFDEE